MKKLITLLAVVSVLTAHAEFGVSGEATFNYKADFRTVAQPQGRANDPGAAVAGTDHVYDDGYSRVDAAGNWDRGTGNSQTTYWGYQNISQDNGGSLTMNSSQNIIDAQQSSGQQSEDQSAIEIYWQEDLTHNERWNIGLRAAIRWQRIEFNNADVYSTTIETISDTYPYSGILPGAPFNGSYGGPNFTLQDAPTRIITTAAGAMIHSTQEIDADIFGLDFGPTLSFDLTEKLRFTGSLGGTVAWIDSEFSYTDGAFAQNSNSESDWLFGAYASADLSYLIGERWGIFGGAAYTRLEDFDQQVDGRSAELQFGDSYTVRAGFFFR